MLDGSLDFWLPEQQQIVSHSWIAISDVWKLGWLAFDQLAHPDFPFAKRMPACDAQALLNVHPRAMTTIRTSVFGGTHVQTELPVDDVLQLAESRLGPCELIANWTNFKRKMPSCSKEGGEVPRADVAGWPRRAAIDALLAAGYTPLIQN